MKSIPLTPYTATIAAGTSASSPVAMGADSLVGIVLPSGWPGSQVTFQGSADGGQTFHDVYTSTGTELAVSTGAGHFVALDPASLTGLNDLVVRNGTGGAPVTVGTDQAITLIGRTLLL